MTATKWTPEGLGYTGPAPVTPVKRLAYAASSKTDSVIVEELLRLAGLTNIDSPLPGLGLTLGTLQPVALPVGTAPASLIKRIDDLTWFDTVEREDGLITRIPRTVVPGAEAQRTYSQGVDLYNLKRTRNLDGAYANVIVSGIAGIGNDGVSTYTVEYRSAFDIPTADGLTDTYTYSDDLIETEEVAETWGTTFMGQFGRVQESYEAELLTGDSSLRAGMTVALVSDKFGLDSSSRFLVTNLRHVAQAGQAFVTYLTLQGSATPTGTDANQAPVAIIKVLYDLEFLDGVRTVIAIFDARESYDPDGTIVTWEWSGSPVTPIVSSNGQQAVAVYTSGAEVGATVTLRIGDNHGKHTTKTLTLSPNSHKDLFVRDLWAATPVDGVIFSNLGGKSWVSVGVPNAAGVCEQAGKTYNLAWDTGGDLWHILALMVSTTAVRALTGAGITAASITINSDAVETGTCWAGSATGHIWRSDESGQLDTWRQVTTTATKLPAEVTYISESPYSLGSLQATSSRGFYISFDAGVTWVLVFQHPNAGAHAKHFTGGFIPLTPTTGESKGFVAFDGTRASGQPHFVMERTDDVHVSTFAFPAADLEVAIEAVTLEVDGSELFAVGTDHLGRGGSWSLAPDASGEFVRKAWDNSRSGAAHHAIRDPRLIKIAYFAAENEVGKAFGGFASTSRIRAGKALKVGIGDLHLVEPIGGAVAFLANRRGGDGTVYFVRLGDEGWHLGGAVPIIGGANLQMIRSADDSGTYYAWTLPVIPGIEAASLQPNLLVSTDNGDTWTSTGKTGVVSVSTDNDGVVYALVARLSHWNGFPDGWSSLASIQKSEDQGTTWTPIRTDFTSYYDGTVHVANIAVDPANPLSMWLRMLNGMHHSSNGGVSDDSGVIFTTKGVNDNFFPTLAYGAGRVLSGPNVFTAVSTSSVVASSEVVNETVGFLAVGTAIYHNQGPPHVGAPALPTSLRKSVDDGVTWTTVDTNDIFNSAGLGYSPKTGAFFSPGHSGDTVGPLGFMRTLPAEGGAWIDVSQQFHDDLGDWYDAIYRTVAQ